MNHNLPYIGQSIFKAVFQKQLLIIHYRREPVRHGRDKGSSQKH